MGTAFLFAVIAVLAVSVLLVTAALRAKKNTTLHSKSTLMRFAKKAAVEVLSANWELNEYYSRFYVYASPELASHMQANKNLLARVLDERKEVLGDFIEIGELELKPQSFKLIPSQVFELTGSIRCRKGDVPIVVLVNAGKELTLDGIKVDKGNLKPSTS